ncbi:MAG TPA: hypothetical protein VGV59_00330, partial [Pyrinomonadaceae bacterium]|nr:hypothetical protein [Pyrinomonadaceae bacterium]
MKVRLRRRYRRASRPVAVFVFCLVCIACGARTLGQGSGQSAGTSSVVEARVHSRALEGNLLGDPAEQKVGIYLPAAYQTSPN